jgi:hypothetical protein
VIVCGRWWVVLVAGGWWSCLWWLCDCWFNVLADSDLTELRLLALVRQSEGCGLVHGGCLPWLSWQNCRSDCVLMVGCVGRWLVGCVGAVVVGCAWLVLVVLHWLTD